MIRRVYLLQTVAPDRATGSMRRYGALVLDTAARRGFDAEIVELAPTALELSAIPAPLRSWIRGRRIVSTYRAHLRRTLHEPCVDHLLDGGHAHILLSGRAACRTIVTCHDLIPLLGMTGQLTDAPPAAPWTRRRIRRGIQAYPDVCRVMTVSDSTRWDLLSATGTAPGVVETVWHPVVCAAHWVGREAVGAASGESPYLLHVGNTAFYKNRAATLRILAHPDVPRDVMLILVGPAFTPSERRLVDELGLEHRVQVLSRVSDSELSNLYARARLLLFPSLYEGFGWPPLEAMQHGCPVVHSETPALMETIGESGLHAPADDIAGLAACCRRLLTDPGLRDECVRKGRANLGRFSESAFADGLASAYEKVFASRVEPGNQRVVGSA